MPIKPAALKALRQNIAARQRNQVIKHHLKKLTVKFRQASTAKNIDQVKTISRDLVKALDRAAQKKVITRNTAGRRKSRLARALKKLTA